MNEVQHEKYISGIDAVPAPPLTAYSSARFPVAPSRGSRDLCVHLVGSYMYRTLCLIKNAICIVDTEALLFSSKDL